MIYIYIYTYIHIHIYIYIKRNHVYIYIYIYIYNQMLDNYIRRLFINSYIDIIIFLHVTLYFL